jgi:endoglucanase
MRARASPGRRIWTWLGAALALLLPSISAPRLAAAQADPGPAPAFRAPLHTDGADLVDADGRPVHLTGVNWFGLETSTFAPHGLWARNYRDMLDQIAQAGFNTVRLPYSNQLFDPGSTPQGIDPQQNPDLQGLTGLEIMDRVIAAAGDRGLSVILDRHRPTAAAQSELWYTDRVPESRWIDDWVMLATRYRGDPTVIGADLHNEPHGPASWGDGNPRTDWRLAAERAGDAIQAANPDWLIIVEGVEHTGDDWYWWGGNLSAAGRAPVELAVPNKLVYSAHDYGPGVYAQRWFSAPEFPNNLPRIWGAHWAYLRQTGVAPVLVGEFGGRSVGSDREGVWQRALLDYLRTGGLSYTYWAWNPDSGDTGGLLADDWSTLDRSKLAMLAAYQAPAPSSDQAPQPSADRASTPIEQAPGPNDQSAPAAPPTRAALTAPAAPSMRGAPSPSPGLVPADAPAGALRAPGGPFDPDPQHVLQGVGGPTDPDPAHRRAREHDERLYLQAFGAPWPFAVYATTP